VTFHLRNHNWTPPLVDIYAAVTLKAAFYSSGFGRANTVISKTQVPHRTGSRWSQAGSKIPCTGRHDPTTYLSLKGCKDSPWGLGQEAAVVKFLTLGPDEMGSIPATLLASTYKLSEPQFPQLQNRGGGSSVTWATSQVPDSADTTVLSHKSCWAVVGWEGGCGDLDS
jgi:hypothetical protein